MGVNQIKPTVNVEPEIIESQPRKRGKQILNPIHDETNNCKAIDNGNRKECLVPGLQAMSVACPILQPRKKKLRIEHTLKKRISGLTLPASNTRIRSDSIMVCKRWAMVNLVTPWN